MKAKKLIWIPLTLSLLAVVSFFYFAIMGMFRGVSSSQIKHYQAKENYKEYRCIVGENRDFVDLGEYGDYRYNMIGLWETNAKIIEASGFWQDVLPGDIVTIVSTDGYFWDSYRRPVVGLKTQDKVYLEAETGKTNQLNDLKQMRKEYLVRAIPSGSLCILGVIGAVVSGVLIGKRAARHKD